VSRFKKRRESISGLAWGDLVCVEMAVAAGLLSRLGARDELPSDRGRLVLGLAIAIVWPFSLWLRETRASSILGEGAEEFRRVTTATLVTFAVVCGVGYMASVTKARAFVVFIALIGFALLLAFRTFARRRLRSHILDRGLNRIVSVGDSEWLSRIEGAAQTTDHRYTVVNQLGITEDAIPTPAAVVEACERHTANGVALSLPPWVGHTWVTELAWQLERSGISIHLDASIVGFTKRHIEVADVGSTTVVSLRPPSHDHPALVVKRGIDILGSILGLAVLSLPMVMIGLLIRLDSSGGALFKQRRVGRHNREFLCWKFRTMRADADAEREALRAAANTAGAIFKMEQDPRITRIGHWLRKYSLDELPQLVNVLQGTMSLVGPRPHPLDDVARYSARDHRRLLAKPGMTGLWQVSGRSNLTWDDAVALDLRYVESWSLTLDFILLFRTVAVVFRGNGAY